MSKTAINPSSALVIGASGYIGLGMIMHNHNIVICAGNNYC